MMKTQNTSEKQKSRRDGGGATSKTARQLEIRRIELENQNEKLRAAQEELRQYNDELLYIQGELQQARDSYAELYDFAPTAYLTVDKDSGMIVQLNVTASELLQVDRPAFNGRFSKFVEPEFADTFHICTRRTAVSPHKASCEIKMHRSDGSVFWGLMDILGDSEAKLLRIAITDITEIKKTQQIKDDFIGMVSHELRTPLTIIMGSISVARSAGISAKEKDNLLNDAAEGSEKLSHILDNLIELSRSQSGRLKLDKTRINIENVLKEIIKPESAIYRGRKVSLEINGRLPGAEVDTARLNQILHNLVDNAVKYSPIKAEIRVIAKRENGHILIEVSDFGKGISAEDREKLFVPFERLHQTSTTNPGLGLGLLVCKHMVEAHGGQIGVTSKPGFGSTFWFTLPAAD